MLPTREALKVEDKSYLMRLGEQCYIDARLPFKGRRNLRDGTRVYCSLHQ